MKRMGFGGALGISPILWYAQLIFTQFNKNIKQVFTSNHKATSKPFIYSNAGAFTVLASQYLDCFILNSSLFTLA